MWELESFSNEGWVRGTRYETELRHAVTGDIVALSPSGGLSPEAMLRYAREVGGPRLRAMTFHERARMLKALAQYLQSRREELYEISKATGATKGDSWIDIEGGIGTLFTYASKGRRELPDSKVYLDGPVEGLSKLGTFVGRHFCVPLQGAAVQINAYNFPCWGMLEKLATGLLAGMPAIVKPATSTSFLAAAMFRQMIESGILPAGSLQLILGSVGDLLDHLTCQDTVAFTGSRETGLKLKTHPRVVDQSVRFNLEADSLNSAILGPDAGPDSPEFELFIKEVAKEITVKAGQKCTAIRRVIVPAVHETAVIDALKAKLASIQVGDPQTKDVRMGPLASYAQVSEVERSVSELMKDCDRIIGDMASLNVLGADKTKGAFFPPTLLRCRDAQSATHVHTVEAFGPVCSLISYSDLDDAIALTNRGDGSLVSSVFSNSDDVVRDVVRGIAPFHGRIYLGNRTSAAESTGHGSPLPHLVHGGPGRAGGGEELGGIRGVLHSLQRTAVQGSPQQLTAASDEWHRGADQITDPVHPFRKYFEELQIGETLMTKSRTVTDVDVRSFANLSGDHFYAHCDDVAAKESLFGARVAHGYLVIAIAAGLFVDPAPGPVIANYGLEGLRFVKPVYIGDTLQVQLSCQSKSPKDETQGVVSWAVDVRNQNGESVAIYTVLTLVKRRALVQ